MIEQEKRNKQKPVWNMYDEGMFYDITQSGKLSSEELEWLNSLKQRLEVDE